MSVEISSVCKRRKLPIIHEFQNRSVKSFVKQTNAVATLTDTWLQKRVHDQKLERLQSKKCDVGLLIQTKQDFEGYITSSLTRGVKMREDTYYFLSVPIK